MHKFLYQNHVFSTELNRFLSNAGAT